MRAIGCAEEGPGGAHHLAGFVDVQCPGLVELSARRVDVEHLGSRRVDERVLVDTADDLALLVNDIRLICRRNGEL